MKQKFSNKWKASKQPRKQRKYRYNAPLHIKRKMMSANLSKELRKKYGRRSFPIRKGDSVKIMRGEFKRKSGKINEANYKKLIVNIDGIYRAKKDGTKVSVYFSPSNLQIKELNLDDVKRKNALEKKIKVNERKKSENNQYKKLPKEKSN